MIPLAIAAGLYLLATVLYLSSLLRVQGQALLPAYRCLELAFLAHAVALAFWIGELGPERLAHLWSVLPVAAWLTVAAYLIIEARFRLQLLGALVVPLVTISLVVSLVAAAGRPPVPPRVEGAVLGIHVLGALLGLGTFCLAAGLSALYLLQERQLKRKNFGAIYRRLPDLHTLDQVSFRLITVGFPIFTLAVVLGAVRAHQGGFGSMGRAYLLALIAWLLFGLVLQGRRTAGWRGRKAALLVLGGFVASTLVLLHRLVW